MIYAVALDRAAQFEDPAPAALALGKMDRGRFFAAGRRLQPFDFFELFYPALDQLGLARLVAKAADEGLHVLDLGALIFVGGLLQLVAALALDQVGGVAALVFDQPSARDLDRTIGHAVEKVAVVRDQDDSARIVRQVILEPVARLEVEMVGRLVEHQKFRAAHQQFRQRDTHPDAAGELGHVAREVGLAEAQSEQHRLGAAVGLIEAVTLEFAQHVAELGERRVVLGAAMMRCQHLFELDPAAIVRLHLAQRRERFLQHRPPAHLGRVLRQIADRRALRARDTARVGRDNLGDHAQQGGLAGAVEADQADPRVVRHRPAHALEDRAAAVEL